ncbi:MarR family transcriptional regulator [Cytobacillus sp. FSL W7-1323]|uniref:MarR family transcriptional regulator n=1 Tax=Cytobacillus kochii TaxID=859143 RepID=A0A286R7U0_9BACI|nr:MULTISPECIES: MarR family transcriptional regulator [Cytobacillus]ASV69451.1 MarR family transcriptional regulator [Cytobacillus kochii]MDQ0184210.1 DNA-binding MarR family transcriptional regulator [Cytobacillus kochii]MEA1852613.1 MarR family transcriptional regulator [Cytobacillus sp. OWB-43]
MNDQTVFELIHAMEQVTNRMIIKWNQSFNEGLGISHILLLSHLKRDGKMKPIDLAESLGIAPSSISHLIQKLSKRYYIKRIPDLNDKRISYLEITDEGLEVLKKAAEDGHQLQKNTFAQLTNEEIKQLLAIYQKLNLTLDQM